MRHWLPIAMLFLSGAAGAVEPVEYIYQARAHVTPAGSVEAVEPQPGMVPQVAAMVVDAVKATHFTPATVNGEAAASKTTVWVKIRFEGMPGDGGQLAGQVTDVSQRNPYMRPGGYPREALVNQVSAKVWLELVLLPDGSVDAANSRVLQADIRASNGRKLTRGRSGTEIQKTALATALGWRLFPEEVAGVHRSTRLVTELMYCAGRSVARRGQCHDFDPGPESRDRAATDAGVQLARLGPAPAAPET